MAVISQPGLHMILSFLRHSLTERKFNADRLEPGGYKMDFRRLNCTKWLLAVSLTWMDGKSIICCGICHYVLLLLVFNASSQIQKQIKITIWWWDEQACLLYISVSQTDLPSIRGAFVILDEGSSPLTRVCLINLSFVKSKYGLWKSWWCYSDTGGVSEVVNIVVTRGWWHDDSANKSGNNIPTKSHLTHLVVIIAKWCFFFFYPIKYCETKSQSLQSLVLVGQCA